MDKLQLDKVIKIATECRWWAEEVQKDFPDLFTSSLCGMCAKASGELFQRLTNANLPAKIAIAPQHAYVIYEDVGVDITATQFGRLEKVFIFDANNTPGHWWRLPRIFYTLEEAVFYQKSVGWPTYQWVKYVEQDGS